METKIFEVRDRGTRIFVIATNMTPNPYYNLKENKLLHEAGFGEDLPMVYLARMDDKKGSYDEFSWPDRMMIAHRFITKHFDEITNGWTVDIEYINHETDVMKVPEYIYHYSDKTVMMRIINAPDNYIDSLRKWKSFKMINDIDFLCSADDLGSLGMSIYEVLNDRWLIPVVD